MNNRHKLVLVGGGENKKLFHSLVYRPQVGSSVNFDTIATSKSLFEVWNVSGAACFNSYLPKSLKDSTAIILCGATEEQKAIVLQNQGSALVIDLEKEKMSKQECLARIDKHIYPPELPLRKPKAPQTKAQQNSIDQSQESKIVISSSIFKKPQPSLRPLTEFDKVERALDMYKIL